MTDDEQYLRDCKRSAASIRKLCAALIEHHGICDQAISSALLGCALEDMSAKLGKSESAMWLRDAADAIEFGRDVPPPTIN